MRQLCAISAAFFLYSSPAFADRVVVLSATGQVDAALRADVEARVVAALDQLSHEVVRQPTAAGGAPLASDELRVIATNAGATWALVPVVHDVGPAAYWVNFRAGYAPPGATPRVEELDAEVRLSSQDDRIRALLAAMIRPEGLSEDGFFLAGEDLRGREAENASGQTPPERVDPEEAARLQAEADARAAEEAARQAEADAALAAAEAEEAERLAREEAARAEQDAQDQAAFAERDRYGVADGLTLVQVGLGVRPLVSTGQGGNGGVLGTLELRAGRGFESVPGLELRGGIDIVFGASSAITGQLGAAYFLSPFAFPLHFGASVEAGIFGAISGDRGAGFLVRASLLASFNLAGSVYLEVSAPEFMYITNAGGALSLGASARLGVRF